MTTPRRSLLTALALAPLVGAANAAPAKVSNDLSALDELDLLELGTGNADAGFADACAAALIACAQYKRAADLSTDADEAALRDAPEFPDGLIARGRHKTLKGPDAGRVRIVEHRIHLDHEQSFGLFWNAVHRRMREAGTDYATAERALRAEFAAWKDADNAVRAHYMVDALDAEASRLGPIARNALGRARAYPVRTADAFAIKLHLCRTEMEQGCEFERVDLAIVLADAARVFAL